MSKRTQASSASDFGLVLLVSMMKYHLSGDFRTPYHESSNTKCISFLAINLQQRLQSRSSRDDMTHQDENMVLEAANSITRLVEDAMMYWSPEYFPMMW